MSITRARIGGLVFDGGEGSHGFFFDLDDGFTGWTDGPGVRRSQTELVSAHGSFDLPGYRDSRVVTISGDCLTDGPEDQQWHRNRLMGVLADGGRGRLTVDDQGTTLWADVRLAGDPQFRVALYGERARYQIQFWAANPRKFGAVNVFTAPQNGTVAVRHYGNFPATPDIWVDGVSAPVAGQNYAVEAFGRRFLVSRPLLADHPHRLDFTTGHLIVDGVVTVGGVLEADTWSVPGGSEVGHKLNMPHGTGTMTVHLPDTYI